MQPFAQAQDGVMFVTYAEDQESAHAAFVADGLPKDGRTRAQPSRKASTFKYTLDGETVNATIVGDVPAEFRDYDPVDVVINIGEQPEDTLVDATVE